MSIHAPTLMEKLQQRVPQFSVVPLLGLGVTVVLWMSCYIVPSDSVAMLQRFGKFQKVLKPTNSMNSPVP